MVKNWNSIVRIKSLKVSFESVCVMRLLMLAVAVTLSARYAGARSLWTRCISKQSLLMQVLLLAFQLAAVRQRLEHLHLY